VVRACHDLSEGGLAVAAAEMAFAGGLGAKISLENVPHNLPSPACGRGAGGEGEAAAGGQWSVVSGQCDKGLPSPACGRGAGGEGGPHPSSLIPHPSSLISLLFAESNTRFLCEVEPERADAFEALLAGVPHARIGEVTVAAKLEICSGGEVVLSADVAELKEAWQRPLRW
jgi:phosphoribosylformylglycinamidine synthase subunit PurSL